MKSQKFLISSSVVARILFTGCSISEKNTKVKPNEIEVSPLSTDYLEYRNKKLIDRAYKKNFIKKEIASPQEELGVYSLNSSKNITYKQQRIAYDDIDGDFKTNRTIEKEFLIITPDKEIEISSKSLKVSNTDEMLKEALIKNKLIEESYIKENKEEEIKNQYLGDIKEYKETKYNKLKSDSSINKEYEKHLENESKEIISKEKQIDKEVEDEMKKLRIYKKAFSEKYPYQIKIGETILKNDLNTGTIYTIGINENNIGIYELKNNNYYELQMLEPLSYKILSENPTQDFYLRQIPSSEMENKIKINFVYKEGIITYYNEKFKKVLPLYEELELKNNDDILKFMLDLSVIDFSSMGDNIKDGFKEGYNQFKKTFN